MTTLCEIQLSCPICFSEFSSRAVQFTNSFGGKRTDFHECAVGAQPLPYFIHTCSKCGYTGREGDFGEEVELSPAIKEHVWDELAPKVPDGPMTGSDKYEFAAKVAMWQGAGPRPVAELLLRAAWCCVDENDVEAERYFRRQASRMFEAALANRDGVEPDERAGLTYLVGELWRRIGDLRRAGEWFDSVPGEVTSRRRQQWIIDAARQQQIDPREWFELT
jgi:uncharacterized protein (DUF2225 family)